jgi:hypothetical protein
MHPLKASESLKKGKNEIFAEKEGNKFKKYIKNQWTRHRRTITTESK